ncbi:bacterial methyltransferase [Rhizoclosmatium globosum]|uniref:Bacterial methyltransferase n=1 Tax=Rhizoclosmatium globosum TaxID=329046 RepID=A0A1Y2BK54_9FUNG|nr:bacterial methyltransferase [Rhizoclosmatium globosum]|eukprot:ORY35153.1 bacterial methyltransferase [Rhizoclosmatium globosum]
MTSPITAAAFSHTPVLLQECLHYISPITALKPFVTRGAGTGRRRQGLAPTTPAKDTSAYTFVDATFGGGGYTKAILERFPSARVIAIDQDPAAFKEAEALALKIGGDRVLPVRGKFGDMVALLEKELGLKGPCIDGVVFDIGVSSYQIDQGYRGFSFRTDGPLDMRMCSDKVHGPKYDLLANSSLTAEHIVNTFSEPDLANIIYENGDEKKSRRIARAIVKARQAESIKTTKQLADIVLKGAGKYVGAIHPATRTFQALRIYVNDELNQFRQGLLAAETLLKPSGTLVGVTFHSLEDTILKNFLRTTSGATIGLGLRYYKEKGRYGYQGIERYRNRRISEVSSIAAMEKLYQQDIERLEERRKELEEGREVFDVSKNQGDEEGMKPSFQILTKKSVAPSDEEVERNVRARSAKLRAAVRTESEPMGATV